MFLSDLDKEIAVLKKMGRYRFLRPLSTAQDAVITINGRQLVNFASNNYLGLANHPEIVAAFTAAAARYGVGAGASRLICGHMDIHAQLEEALARLKGTEACLTFSSGYLANLGILATLGGPRATVFSDELNHSSIIDGCRLSRSRVEIYRHADADRLEALLKTSKAPRKIIVTDSVFSMDGDIAPLPDLVALRDRYGAVLVVDDAHAVGVLPPRGCGSAEYFNLPPEAIDVQMGTLSKALGTYGAYICASKKTVDYFINTCRTFIYNTGLPPALAGAAIKAVEMLSAGTDLLRRLWENRESFIAEMAARGRPVESPSAIMPLITGGDRETMVVSAALYERGLFVHGIRPPSVPQGMGRLRLTLMATHTTEMVRTAAACVDELFGEEGLKAIGKKRYKKS
jgi:8-amino-7-oxononanoate synthase